jgi:hypothetical protein
MSFVASTTAPARRAGVAIAAVMAVLALALSALAGCGDGGASAGDQPAIADGMLTGTVGGKPWTLVTAETDSFLSSGDTFFATLYAEAFTPCTGAGFSVTGDHLIFTIPKTAGDHALSLSLTETFTIQTSQGQLDNLIATRGHIVVDSVAAAVTGGAAITYDAQNTVSGHFQITVCP